MSDKSELVKLNDKYLEKVNGMESLVTEKFGNWTTNIDNIKTRFLNANPFEHVIIDNFLEDSYANELAELFPENFDDWYKYENPIEYKYTYDNIEKLDKPLCDYFYYLSTDVMINIFRNLTNIGDLTYDEFLHGAGLHCHPRNGKLNVHLDYEKHPLTGKERRMNIILFLTKEWNPEWNGQNELWNKDATECVAKTDVKFNRAIIFKTNDISWHGLPNKINCPTGYYRKSLAFYYLSPLKSMKNEDEYRKKAKYTTTGVDVTDMNYAGLQKLCEIRSNRRLEQADIDLYYAGWKNDL